MWRGRLLVLAVIIAVMIVCWYWIFPWLEQFLPSTF